MNDVINATNDDAEKLVRSVCPEYPPEYEGPDPLAPVFLTAGLIAIFAIGIVVGTWLMWQMPFGTSTLQVVLCSLLGMLLSLPVLFSVWAALGEQTWLLRIPIAMGCEFVLLCLYLLVIRAQGGGPLEAYWMIFIIAVAVNIVAQIPMWVLRIWRGARLSRCLDAAAAVPNSQFSIRQLLIATALVAILLTIFQWTYSKILNSGEVSSVPVFEMAGFCGIFMLDMGWLTVLSLVVVFSRKLRRWALPILGISLVGISLAAVGPIDFVLGRGLPPFVRWLFSANILFFSSAFSATLILVLFLYHLIGYRLRFRTRRSM